MTVNVWWIVVGLVVGLFVGTVIGIRIGKAKYRIKVLSGSPGGPGF